MMYNSNTKWIIAMSVTAIAIGAMVFIGNGLSTGIAQMSDSNSDKSWSGTLNSIVENANNEKFIVGGEWTLSLDGNNVTEFSADIDMVSIDGTGAHTHRITSDGVTNAASIGNLGVVLVPTEQSAGGVVLVNVTGLAAGSNVTVKVDDNIAGMTESDEDGNLLYAIGTAESMIGSVTVSVEDDEGNTGSALLTVTEAQESSLTNGTESTNNTSSSTVNNNLTRTNTSNTTSANGTSSSDSGDNSTGTAGFQNNTSGSDSSADQAGYTMPTEIRSPTYGSENTTQSTHIMKNETTTASSAAVSNLTSSTGPNAMNATGNENVTSSTNESTVIAEIASNTTTFTTEADIYLNGEPKWEDVEITVSLMNGKVLTIEIDPEATDGHFGQEPIYGIVTLAGDLFR